MSLHSNHRIAWAEFRRLGECSLKQKGQQQLGDRGAKRLCLVLVAFCSVWPSTATAQVKEVRRVLFFTEGNLSSPAVAAADQEIRAGLEKSPYAIEHYSKYTEPVLFPREASYRRLREWYRDRKPDVIIAAGPSPIKFLVESHEKLFGDTPIVICGSSEEQADHLKPDSHFTGVWITIDPTKTLEAGMQLQPSTQHVVVVGGVSSYDKSVEAIVREGLRGYESKLEFVYLTDLAMPALLERLRHLSDNTLVLYTALTQDAAGTDFISATESLPMVVSVANAPVFTLADTLVGQGTVGGYVVSFAAQGWVAAKIAMRVLQGERPQDIPITRGANLYLFDWRALQRWGFKESTLHADSIVLNRQPTVWQSYGRYILGAALLLLAQTLLILGLLWQRARKREVEKSLAERLAFEGLLSDLSTTFINLPEEQVTSKIEESLGRIAEFLQLDRITLFECSQGGTELTVTSSWISKGAEPVLPNSKPIPWPWWEGRRLSGEPVTFSDPRLPPDEASHIRRYLLESGIQSIASVPLGVGGEIVGALSFVSTKRRVMWTEDLVTQLKVLAEIFSNALKRKRVVQALLASNSELKRSEVVLRESEERLRLAAQAGRMFAYEWDATTDVIVRSAEGAQILGADEATHTTGQRISAMVHPDDRERLTAVVANLSPENPYLEISYRMVRPDGNVIWVERNSRAHFDEQGRMLRVIGMVADITERKRIEEALRESEERLHLAVQGGRMYAFEWDAATDVIVRSGECAAILNWMDDPTRDTGRQFAVRVHPDDREAYATPETGLTPGNPTYQTSYRVLRPNGSVIWLEANGHVFFDGEGRIQRIIGMVADVTERKQAEDALHESEERFRLVANNAPVLIWMSGADKLCTFFNKRWLDFTGRSMEQELGEGWASGVHPDDLERCLRTYSAAFDARADFEMEYRLRRFDREYRWIVDYGVPRFESNGTFCGYIGSCVDITDRKLSEASLQELSGRLIHAQEEERARIARELHDDLSQRMALLQIGLEQVAQDAAGLSSKIRQQLHDITKVSSEVSSNLHDLSHQLHPYKLDTLGLVAALGGFCNEFSRRHNLQVQFVDHDVPGQIPQDVTLCLFRIAQEALRNVLKHSGASEASVELSSHSDGIDLRISDPGVGFYPDSVKGESGLGLISMRERLRLVGGQFLVESEPSHGTRVRVRVPLPTGNAGVTSKEKANKAGA